MRASSSVTPCGRRTDIRPPGMLLAITDSSKGASLSSALANLASSSTVQGLLVRRIFDARLPLEVLSTIISAMAFAAVMLWVASDRAGTKVGSVAARLGSTVSGLMTNTLSLSNTKSAGSLVLPDTGVTQSLTTLSLLKTSEAASPYSSLQRRTGLL